MAKFENYYCEECGEYLGKREVEDIDFDEPEEVEEDGREYNPDDRIDYWEKKLDS